MTLPLGFTLLGLVFVPVTVLIALLRPRYLLSAALIAAILQGAAVYNYRTSSGTIVPIIPFYFVEILIAIMLVFELPQWRKSWGKIERSTRIQLYVLALFAVFCAASSVLLTRAFAGTLVDRPRAGLDASYFHLQRLRFTLSNVAQDGYILLNTLFLFWVATIAAHWDLRRVARLSFTAASSVAVLLGVYQKISFSLGWPFPTTVVDSNGVVFRARGYEQATALFARRVSSTFSEPSFAGAFLGAASIYYLVLAVRSPLHRWPRLTLALGAALVVLWTGASTGYAVLGASWGLFAVVELALPLLRRHSVRAAALGIFATLTGLTILGASLFWDRRWTEVLNGVLLHKVVSVSAVRRFAADRVAWHVFLHTWGAGVGFGSERPSSLLLYLLGNVGVIGAGLFAVAMCWVFVALRRAWRRARGLEERAQMGALGWAIAANLLALLGAIPDPTWELMWALWAMTIVFCAHSATAESGVRYPPEGGRTSLARRVLSTPA